MIMKRIIISVLLGQQVPASLGCVHCRSNNQGECGLRTSLGQSPSTSLQQSCPLGTEYCYTYVQVSFFNFLSLKTIEQYKS
jgi:hypothetical protein